MTTRTHTSECAKATDHAGADCTCGARYELGVEDRLKIAERRIGDLERIIETQAHTVRDERAKIAEFKRCWEQTERRLAEARDLAKLYRDEAVNPEPFPWEAE